MNTHLQKFSVAFDYPVIFTRDVFNPDDPTFCRTLNRLEESRRHRVMVFVDAGVAEHHPELIPAVEQYVEAKSGLLELVMPPMVLPGGEPIKNDYRKTMEIVDLMLEHQLCRHSFVVAIGGGAVLDAVGFAVSIVHRGLRMIRLPSTVLSQNDAGIGVKTGMNLHGGKNTIGTFHPPFAVINDLSLLNTLSDGDWRAGIAEAFKVAIIKDRPFFEFLRQHASALKSRDEEAMEQLVARCAELHLEHIRSNGDPFELGAARPLDFGHWSAHKLETMSGYQIGHGQAVVAGIALDACYARNMNWITPDEFRDVHTGLSNSGLKIWYREMDRRLGDGSFEILQGLADFREHLGGELCITFPKGIGRKKEVREIDSALVQECLAQVRALAASEAESPSRMT